MTPATETDLVLSARGLSAGYTEVDALRSLDIELRSGEVVAVIGANGAGKSTMMGALMGLLLARNGTVSLFGHDVTREPVHTRVHRGLSLVPEGRRILGPLTVEENLRLGRRRGRSRPPLDLTASLDRVYDLFPRLKDRVAQRAGSLSGGEQQMLAIGRALMSAPEILLLDEPSLGLAPTIVESVFAALEELRSQGLPMIIVEQNAHLVLDFADRGYVLQSGEVELSGDASELAASDRLVAAYLGEL